MKLSVIHTGLFKLDGGAMFGIVPKVIWDRINPADQNNLCTWAMRCLLIEDGNRKILIDTGLGDKQDERFRSHFHPHGDMDLHSSLKEQMISPEDITDVIITHFHFDHVGGAVSKDNQGNLIPTFPHATYWSNRPHYDWAYDPNPREAASFLKENFVPLYDQGVLRFIDVGEDVPFTDRISFNFYHGHTEAMMVPFIQLDNGKTLVYTADLLPSTGHIKMPYVMSYDIRPLMTLAEKEKFYDKAANDDHIIFFEHDKDIECGVIGKNEKGRYSAVKTGDLREFVG